MSEQDNKNTVSRELIFAKIVEMELAINKYKTSLLFGVKSVPAEYLPYVQSITEFFTNAIEVQRGK